MFGTRLRVVVTVVVAASLATTGAVAGATAAQFGASGAAVSADQFEPNDTRESATEIEPGSYDGLSLVADDNDFYVLSVEAGETVDITVTVDKNSDGEQPANDPFVQLENAEGEGIEAADEETSSVRSTTTYRIQHEFESPQTVYIRVWATDDDEDVTASYDLTLERAANDEREPDGVPSLATAIDPGVYSGTLQDEESDYFSIAVGPGETLNVTLTVPKAADGERPDNDPAFALEDAQGETIEFADQTTTAGSETTTHRIQHEFDGERTVYLHAFGTDDSQSSTPYTLTVERAANDEREPDGVIGRATRIEPGSYRGTLQDEESDYFAVSVGAGETLNVTLSVPKAADGEEPDNDPFLELVNAQGEGIEGTDGTTTPASDSVDFQLHHEFDSQRTVYVRVRGTDDSDTSTPYELTVQRAANDPREPDGVRGRATEIEPGSYQRTLQDEEHDYHAISVDAGETLNATLTVPKEADGEEPDNDPFLELQTADGEGVGYADGETDPIEDTVTYRVTRQFESDQTVYVLVGGSEDSDTATPYELTVERGVNDQFEPNGVPAAATVVDDGTYRGRLQGSEDDYYAVTVGAGATVDVTVQLEKVDGERPPTDPTAELVVDGDGVAYSEGQTDSTADLVTYDLSHTVETQRTVLVRVSGSDDGNVEVPYDLSIETSGGATLTPTPSPTPTASPSPTPTAEPTPTPEPTPTAEPTPTPESTPTAEPTPTAGSTAESTPTPEPTPVTAQTAMPESTPTAEPTPVDEGESADDGGDAGTTSSGSPGFGVAVAVVALVALTLAAGRRRTN